MTREEHVWIFVFVLPTMILAIPQNDIIEINVPDAGNQGGSNRLPFYRHVLDLISDQCYIRFAVKTGANAYILLSENPSAMIDYNTDSHYVEIEIGGYSNTKSIIRVGTLGYQAGLVDTADILNSTSFRMFWISWAGDVIKVGKGLNVGQYVIIDKTYPSTIRINHLSVFNGFGFSGSWKIFLGIMLFEIFWDGVQSFGKIHDLVSVQDRGGSQGVRLGKLEYKIAFLY